MREEKKEMRGENLEVIKEDHKENLEIMKIEEIISIYIDNVMYIDIERHNIDDALIGGFPLYITNEFLVLSKVYDFRNDGITILRIKDITKISPFGHNSFIEDICKSEGLDKIQNPYINLDSINSILSSIDTKEHYVTIQCEESDTELYFSIGIILNVADDYVSMKVFNTNGKWDSKVREIPYKEITLISIDDYYSKMLFKYKDRIKI